MNIEKCKIQHTNAIIIGEKKENAFLFVHGQAGNKEEAIRFANIAVPLGYQVIGIDLSVMDVPWNVLPKLLEVKDFLKEHYSSISLRANSIGCWYSLLAFENEKIEQALFVSPILDMKRFVEGMEEKDEQYYEWVVLHQIANWSNKTYILRAEKDLFVSDKVNETFINQFMCNVVTLKDSEHWLHTPEQLSSLRKWEESVLKQQYDDTQIHLP